MGASIVVQSATNSVEFGVTKIGEGSSFGKVLAQQSIEVLVGAVFPGVVRFCEVAGYRVAGFDLAIGVELGAVVEGDGFEQMGFSTEDCCEGSVSF